MIEGSHIEEEKEVLKGMLTSMNVPIEKYENLSSLVEMGFSASQVAKAIMEKKTFESEDLMDTLTKDTTGNFDRITEF